MFVRYRRSVILRTRARVVKRNLARDRDFFARARDYGPATMECTRRRFEELVSEALDAIPDDLGERMENIAVVVEEWPTSEQVGDRSGTLLGLYEGIDLTRRGPMSYEMVMPDKVTIFRGPICAICETEDDLRRQVYVTVVHEIGHHFGIDDERLGELGWA